MRITRKSELERHVGVVPKGVSLTELTPIERVKLFTTLNYTYSIKGMFDKIKASNSITKEVKQALRLGHVTVIKLLFLKLLKNTLSDADEKLIEKFEAECVVKKVAPRVTSAPIRKSVKATPKELAIGLVEEWVDEFHDDFVFGRKSMINFKERLAAEEFSNAQLSYIIKFYGVIVAQLNEACQTDAPPDLRECYGGVNICKRRRAFFKSIVNGAQYVIDATFKKAAKVKSPTEKTKHLYYSKGVTIDTIKLKSITPAKIIGANVLWLYRPDTRKLVLAKSQNGFEVKGQEILNVSSCMAKTIRKPEDIMPELMGKRRGARIVFFDSLSGGSKPTKVRMHRQMIILGVGKE